MSRALTLAPALAALFTLGIPGSLHAAEPMRPIVLLSADELRLPPPPRHEPAAPAARAAGAASAIERWNAGWPGYRWTSLALDALQRHPTSNPRATRVLAALHVAMSDGMVAAWDSKTFYRRARPIARAIVAVPDSPSYPEERAVAAGAAAAILSWAFPDDAALFASQADEAAASRVDAGVARPSDVSAGLTLGRRVAERVLARVQKDGSDAVFTGAAPAIAGKWNGTKPVEPVAGTWKPWVLESGAELRPAAPPEPGSVAKNAELAEITGTDRTFERKQKALYWQTFDGIFRTWYDDANRLLFEHDLVADAPRAARVMAAAAIAHADSSIACWDAKYAYWAARPFMLDAKSDPLFATPNHPSYPAAHGCYSGAFAATLARAFPDDAARLTKKAQEAAESRIWAGLHFRSDVDAGLELGRKVADRVATRLLDEKPATTTTAEATFVPGEITVF
jgi:hypothetical protein